MKQFLDQLGLGDGQGNTSSYRVVMYVLLLFFIGYKFYNAHLTRQPIEITTQDCVFLGSLLGGKLIQNRQENATTPAQ